jgi:hypothetical protein
MKIIALIQKNILLVLLGTSVTYILWYLVYKYQLASPTDFTNSIWTNLYDIALTLLGSGIFLATLKYFQFLGFFLDEIKKVIYSDDYLKEQKNIYEIWQRVTKALFKSELPEPIVDNMLSDIFKTFLSKDTLDHYYKSSYVKYNIGIDESGYVTIDEYVYYKIINRDRGLINFELKYFLSTKSTTDSITSIKLKNLKINNSIVEDSDPNLHEGRNNQQKFLTFNKSFENLNLCEIEHQITLKQSIDVDREFYYTSHRIAEDMTITIDNKTPDNLGIIFTEIGISSFKKLGASSGDVYKGNGILPQNGFKLFFYRKH